MDRGDRGGWEVGANDPLLDPCIGCVGDGMRSRIITSNRDDCLHLFARTRRSDLYSPFFSRLYFLELYLHRIVIYLYRDHLGRNPVWDHHSHRFRLKRIANPPHNKFGIYRYLRWYLDSET